MQGEIGTIHPVRMDYVYCTCTQMYLLVHGRTCTYMRAGSAHVHPFNHDVSKLEGARIRVKKISKRIAPLEEDRITSLFDRANPFSPILVPFSKSLCFFSNPSLQFFLQKPASSSVLPVLPLIPARLGDIFLSPFICHLIGHVKRASFLSLVPSLFSLLSLVVAFEDEPPRVREYSALTAATAQYVSAMYLHVRPLYLRAAPVQVHQISYKGEWA